MNNRIVISLDIGNCLIPWGRTEKIDELRKIVIDNLFKISSLKEEYDFLISIHSDLGQNWDKLSEKDGLNNWFKNMVEEYFEFSPIIRGKENRREFLNNLKKNYKVIALDDYDLSSLEDNNFISISTFGKVDYKKVKNAIEKLRK